jgi:hypothetical protein
MSRLITTGERGDSNPRPPGCDGALVTKYEICPICRLFPRMARRRAGQISFAICGIPPEFWHVKSPAWQNPGLNCGSRRQRARGWARSRVRAISSRAARARRRPTDRDRDSKRGHHDFQWCGPVPEVCSICRGLLRRGGASPVPGFPGLCARFPVVTADRQARLPFRRTGLTWSLLRRLRRACSERHTVNY